MTAESLTRSSAALRQRADEIAQALTDFRAQPGYQKLAEQNLGATSGPPNMGFGGVTLQTANTISDRLGQLFDGLERVYASLDRADAAILAGSGLLGNAEKLREAEEILTPLSMDDLAAGVRQAQETLAAIEQSCRTLPARFGAASREAGSLREMVSADDANTRHQLDRICEKLEALRPDVACDPLGVEGEFGAGVVSPLAALRQALGEAARTRQQLTDSLAAADGLYGQLTTAAREAQAAYDEAKSKVGEVASTPPDVSSVQALGEWLHTLRQIADQGMTKPVVVGVEHWTTKARRLLEEVAAAAQTNRAPVLARRELRGLMQALKAKAVARGAAEDAGLLQLAEEANALLYAKPTPMARATELVHEYERRLNGR